MTIENNQDTPAMPIELNGFGQFAPEAHTGLTKREMFAMHAMQAWIQHHGVKGDYCFTPEDAAASSLQCADALLKELEK